MNMNGACHFIIICDSSRGWRLVGEMANFDSGPEGAEREGKQANRNLKQPILEGKAYQAHRPE